MNISSTTFISCGLMKLQHKSILQVKLNTKQFSHPKYAPDVYILQQQNFYGPFRTRMDQIKQLPNFPIHRIHRSHYLITTHDTDGTPTLKHYNTQKYRFPVLVLLKHLKKLSSSLYNSVLCLSYSTFVILYATVLQEPNAVCKRPLAWKLCLCSSICDLPNYVLY